MKQCLIFFCLANTTFPLLLYFSDFYIFFFLIPKPKPPKFGQKPLKPKLEGGAESDPKIEFSDLGLDLECPSKKLTSMHELESD